MSLITSIVQPHYLPYIGYFSMIKRSDNFIFHDDVDYIKGEWKNRNRIRMEKKNNKIKYLTVPIKKQSEKKINKLKISYDKNWINDHLNCIKNVYSKENYYFDVIKILNSVYEKKPFFLSELNINIIKEILKYLEINTKIFYSSQFNSSLKKTEKVVFLCQKVKTSIYLANNKSSDYLEELKFKEKNINLIYQDYLHPQYKQGNNSFIPFLSIIDLIAYHGKKSTDYL